MLSKNLTYRDNNGRLLRIGGRVKGYSKEKKYVYSLCGNWYCEDTGSFVMYNIKEGNFLISKDNYKSISDHNPVPEYRVIDRDSCVNLTELRPPIYRYESAAAISQRIMDDSTELVCIVQKTLDGENWENC